MPFSADLLCSFWSLYLCHDKCTKRRKNTTRQLAVEVELKRCSSSLSTKIQRESFLETFCSDFRFVLVWAPLPFKKECYRTLHIYDQGLQWLHNRLNKKMKNYDILTRSLTFPLVLSVLVDTIANNQTIDIRHQRRCHKELKNACILSIMYQSLNPADCPKTELE